MKGQSAIYQSLFAEPTPTATLAPVIPMRRGRSEALKNRQNEQIVCRYYYLVKLQGMQYEATIEKLESEIHLSKRTIIDILCKESAHLKMLQQAKPDVKYFEKKYPWINW